MLRQELTSTYRGILYLPLYILNTCIIETLLEILLLLSYVN
jgi:hypothetical protein